MTIYISMDVIKFDNSTTLYLIKIHSANTTLWTGLDVYPLIWRYDILCFYVSEKESSRAMSTESVKGSEGDNLTSSSDAQNETKQENSGSQDGSPNKTEKTTSDSEGEAKIKADAEEAEKQRSSSAGSRAESDKEGEGADEYRSESRHSRSGSGGRKSPGGTSRPRSSDTRPKSSSSRGSGEVTFGAKSKKKKKKGDNLISEGHQVTFTVTISVAIPTGNCHFIFILPYTEGLIHLTNGIFISLTCLFTVNIHISVTGMYWGIPYANYQFCSF